MVRVVPGEGVVALPGVPAVLELLLEVVWVLNAIGGNDTVHA